MPDRIEVVEPIRAPRERLWAALTEPLHLANWQADVARSLEHDGTLQLGWPALGVETELCVVEQRARERLVLSSGRSRVTFEIHEETLRLTHDGLVGQDEIDGVRSSWHVALKVLDHYLCHHYKHPRRVHWSVATVATSAATAHVFFTDATALDAWLTLGTSGLGEIGSPCHLSFAWGETLSGTVLARAPERDVAITWRERQNSVLIFRTLPSPSAPGERMLAVSWSHWNCDGDDRNARAGFDGALLSLKRLMAASGNA